MGSPSDEDCKDLGVPCQLRVTSAHKGTEETMQIVAQYEGSGQRVVLIAVAGRSNGLGPVLSGNSCLPVNNCPVKPEDVTQDIYGLLSMFLQDWVAPQWYIQNQQHKFMLCMITLCGLACELNSSITSLL